MRKDNFFDTNVVFNYCKFTKNTKLEMIKRCYEYVKNKKGKFIICYFLEWELKNIVRKNKIIHKEIIEKIKPELEKVISFLEKELQKIRTSRVSPSLVEDITVDYSGQKFSLKHFHYQYFQSI